MNEKRDVFISYHTDSAKPITELIASILESRGISCWYAPRDCENEWDDAIIQALEVADIFLLILNSFSSNSEHVKNEVAKAFSRYSKKEMTIIVFQIDNEPVSKSIDYWLGRIHRVNGVIPPIEDRVLELVYRVEYTKINGKKVDLSEESRFESSYVSSNITFVGRKKELQEMKKSLKDYHHISISGMGGIGKSYLIREFVCKNKKQYRAILWATYDGSLKKTFCNDNEIKITNFFRNPPEENDDSYFSRKIDFFKNNSSEEDLLIIDNFNSLDDDDLKLILSLPISIIFSSRFSQEENGIYDIKLKSMNDKSELFELFTRNYPRIISPKDELVIKEIIDYVQGHTLSIVIISKIMRDKRINASMMLELLKDSNKDSKDINNVINDALISLFNVSNINNEEKKVLSNLIFVPYSGMFTETFFDLCKLDSYIDIDSLISKNWIIHNPSMDYISLHPLVAHLMNKQIGTPDIYCENYLISLIDKMSNAKYLRYEEKEFYLPFVERGLRYIKEDSKFYDEFFIAAGKFFHAFARHWLTINYLSEFVQKEFVPLECRVEAQIDVADAYRCLHDKENLLKEIQKAEELYDELDNKEVYQKLYVAIISRYGWYEMYSKEYQKAYNCFKKHLDIQTSKLSDDLQNVGWSYYTVGYSLEMLGRYEEAIENHEKALTYFHKIDMSFAVANSLKSMAAIYVKLNQLDKAKEYLEKALELFIQNVGDKHIDTAITKRALSSVYSSLNINTALAMVYKDEADNFLNDIGFKD